MTEGFPIPAKDPVGGGSLYISELTGEETGITIRGRFEIPRYAKLEPDQARFLETFLRCRGVLSSVEKELGISYPTVRSRLDALLEALELAPVAEEKAKEHAKDDKAKEEKARDEKPKEERPRAAKPSAAEADASETAKNGKSDPTTDELTDDAPAGETPAQRRLRILDRLERGELTPAQARELLARGK